VNTSEARSESRASEAHGTRLGYGPILLYTAPMAGVGFMDIFAAMYLMKFATDVLGLTPAAMGVAFLVSRIVGAASDPIAGFLSDRTRTRFGRRRPWLLAMALPLAAIYALLWSPPAALGPEALALWVGVCFVLYQAVLNFYSMPHDALGAELSDDYHDRTRIFGTRRAVFGVGAVAVFGAVAQLTAASDARAAASWIAIGAGVATALLTLALCAALRERAEFQGRGAERPFQALADVWRNEHARLLLAVFFVQQLGIGAITIVTAYYTEYVFGAPEMLPVMLGTVFGVSIACVPLWIALGRRFDKKQLLVASMAIVCVALGTIFFVAPRDMVALMALAVVVGAAMSGADVVFPSVQADVIDCDEQRTGQRKEGVYFAAWNFVAKTALGVAGVITGAVLSTSGFVANQEQSESAKLAIRGLMSIYPLVCYGLGSLLFLRFRLDHATHSAIRAELDARRSG
jgi:GPH family glycoside/pentoside/hexuronide:cation symporter